MGRLLLVAGGLAAPFLACAQYPGQVKVTGKETPELRAIAVLEWTGDAGKPKASRLVPVAVLDNGQLQDGSVYLARPEPMAVAGYVEYELEENGKPIGLYDIKDAGQEQGSWVGYGTWLGMPRPKPKPSMAELAKMKVDEEDENGDRPVLHRKKHSGDSGGGKDSSEPAPPADPDRPQLHKKDGSGNPSDASAAGNSGSAASDPDRPTLHKKDTSSDTSDAASGSAAADADPDRPVLKKAKKKKPEEEVGYSEGLAGVTDPDRPMLKRGKSNSDSLAVTPSLMGLPPDLQQAVAVSDAKSHPEHIWTFSWSSPDDEAKMKSGLEDMARDALGLKTPPLPPAPKKTAAHKTTRKTAPAPPPLPPPLLDEQFHVYELAYGSGATMVLSAHTAGPPAQMKFVTLIAQPDLYGNIMVLLKSVTDGAHLDETPRMKLVDAVDAMADNRGELLFELRGSTMRQFALYRVLRGQAEKLLVSGGDEFGSEAAN